jgi:GrpB-like predicted nucleotidyltransferase (UPF0157 family)
LAALFVEEAARIRRAVGEIDAAIEHVGSTSIGGIAAKPIIDIAVGLKISTTEKNALLRSKISVTNIEAKHGIAGRFISSKAAARVSLAYDRTRQQFWRSHLLFRDYLRSHPPMAKEYEDLKLELARKYGNNREAYQNGKTEFIGIF